MIVDDFYVVGVTVSPLEAYTQLGVDANAVLTGTIATEFLKTIGWRHTQILQFSRPI